NRSPSSRVPRLTDTAMRVQFCSPRFLAGLREAAARDDAAGMHQAAHALKSSSALLGAMALSTRCEEVERQSRAGTVFDAVARVAAIEDLYRAVTRALEAEAARLATGAGQAASFGPA